MVLFHEASMWQQRNEHDLMRDFEDEIPGYLYNRRIAEVLDTLSLSAGVENTPDNLRLCYEELVRRSLFAARELPLLEAWLQDLSEIRRGGDASWIRSVASPS